MIIFGLVWKKRPPKTINNVYGYRTRRSMKSYETWDFAHKYAGKILLYSGVSLMIISIALLFIFKSNNNDKLAITALLIIAIQLLSLYLPIFLTEIALKKKFNEI